MSQAIDLSLPNADNVVHNIAVFYPINCDTCRSNNNIVAWFVSIGILFVCDSLYHFRGYVILFFILLVVFLWTFLSEINLMPSRWYGTVW